MNKQVILGLALLSFVTAECSSQPAGGSNETLALPAVEGTPPEQLATIVTWLSADFALPQNYEHPRIEFASPTKMASVRYGALGAGFQARVVGDDQLLASMRDTVALYEDASRTIYLREGWTGATPAEMSVLVHEMVHHLQNLAGEKFECAQARERSAYAAQQKWLAAAGQDFFQEFETDPLTLKLRTICSF